MRRIVFILAGVFLHCAFTLCQTEALQLKSVFHFKPPYKDHWFYHDNVPAGIVATNPDSSSVIMFYDFRRNDAGNLLETWIEDVSQTLIYKFIYYRDSFDRIIKIEKYADQDYDNKVDELDHSFSFIYDSLDQVSRIKVFKYDRVARDLRLKWENGNIITVENVEGEMNYRMELTFDAKPNVLQPIKWEYITTTGNLEFFVLMFCANNVVSAEFFPTTMDSYFLEIEAEYDENGNYRTNHFELVEFEYY